MTQNELKIFFWLWIVGFRPVNVERKHGVTSCAGYVRRVTHDEIADAVG